MGYCLEQRSREIRRQLIQGHWRKIEQYGAEKNRRHKLTHTFCSKFLLPETKGPFRFSYMCLHCMQGVARPHMTTLETDPCLLLSPS